MKVTWDCLNLTGISVCDHHLPGIVRDPVSFFFKKVHDYMEARTQSVQDTLDNVAKRAAGQIRS